MVVAEQATRARELVGRIAHELQVLDAPLGPAAVRHARGFLEKAAGRWPDAAKHFRAAAEQYELLGCPYEAAQACEQAGSALVRFGDVQTGTAQLRAALTTFQRLGATWDLDRASRIARQHGVPVPARHRGGRQGYGAELSPREREVAELAAIGKTNTEIASELFVSVSTVKKHLSASMRKLGISSRAALAHRLTATRGQRRGSNIGPTGP